jgi:dTDP-4-amino-4,6-dideoxygalactose transaminase
MQEHRVITSDRVSTFFRTHSSKSWHGARVPFNALETRNWDLFAALAWFIHSNRLAALRNSLQELTGRQHIILTPSGRSAIAQVLASLPHREVVMPAWICHEVKRAAEIAGKRVIYVDLGSNNINATSAEYLEAAKPGRILLIAHLFGVPTDVEAICELARKRDCMTIEDGVPALGARRNGRLLGTFADFGIFGFEQGKRFPAFHGGVIVVNSDHRIDSTKLAASRVVETKRVMPIGDLLGAIAHNLATSPWIYRSLILPLLPLRETLTNLLRSSHSQTSAGCLVKHAAVLRTASYTREMHPYQAELVLRMLNRIEQIRQQISCLASIYLEIFRDTPIASFVPAVCDIAGLMRFPISFPGKDRAEILRRAEKRGLYLKVYWPQPLPDKSEHHQFPNAVWAAENIVLLPLYGTLSPRHAELVAQTIVEIERTVPVCR